MFVSYNGLKIHATISASRELFKESKTLFDVLEILELGEAAPRKRRKGTVEKWLSKGNKTYSAVVIRGYNKTLGEEDWVLVHFGKFTRKKK